MQEEVRLAGQAGGPHELQRGAQLPEGQRGEEEEDEPGERGQQPAQPRLLRGQPGLLPLPRLRVPLQ